MPRAGRKTKRWATGCGLVVATVAAAVWLSWPRERLLLKMARPVLAIDTSSDGSGNPKEVAFWLDVDRLVIIARDDGDALNNGDWHGHADVFDISTHTRTRSIGLTDFLNNPHQPLERAPSAFEPSPGGTWLLFQNHPQDKIERRNRLGSRNWYEEAGIEGDTTICKRESRQSRRWVAGTNDITFWVDENHCARMLESDAKTGDMQHPSLKLYDLRDPQAKPLPTPSSYQAISVLRQYDESHPLTNNVYFSGDGSYGAVSTSFFDGSANSIQVRSGRIKLPKNARVIDWPNAPHLRDAILHGQRVEIPTIATWLHRVLPFVSADPVTTEELWVAGLDSEVVQELGHLPGRFDTAGTFQRQIEQIQRSPDGRKVSFVCHGRLFVMPITTAK